MVNPPICPVIAISTVVSTPNVKYKYFKIGLINSLRLGISGICIHKIKREFCPKKDNQPRYGLFAKHFDIKSNNKEPHIAGIKKKK